MTTHALPSRADMWSKSQINRHGSRRGSYIPWHTVIYSHSSVCHLHVIRGASCHQLFHIYIPG